MNTAAIRTPPEGSPLERLTGTIAQIRATLRRRLSTRPNAIQTTAGAERLELRSPHAHWIVGRGLCMYRREDFSNVPRNRRRAAVELRLPVWSPFRNTGHHCVWSGGVAMVWFWDNDKVQVAPDLVDIPAGDEAAANAGVRIVPETVFHPTKPDGVHLQACREGFELQRWKDAVLEDAFWFPGEPGPDDLTWFRGRSDDIDTAVPAGLTRAAAAPLLPDPWSSALTPKEWLEVNEAPWSRRS